MQRVSFPALFCRARPSSRRWPAPPNSPRGQVNTLWPKNSMLFFVVSDGDDNKEYDAFKILSLLGSVKKMPRFPHSIFSYAQLRKTHAFIWLIVVQHDDLFWFEIRNGFQQLASLTLLHRPNQPSLALHYQLKAQTSRLTNVHQRPYALTGSLIPSRPTWVLQVWETPAASWQTTSFDAYHVFPTNVNFNVLLEALRVVAALLNPDIYASEPERQQPPHSKWIVQKRTRVCPGRSKRSGSHLDGQWWSVCCPVRTWRYTQTQVLHSIPRCSDVPKQIKFDNQTPA
jgi:hypothetical protein